MEQLEYETLDMSDLPDTADLKTELNKLGEQGWELVLQDNHGVYVFIRTDSDSNVIELRAVEMWR
jgi:hypothetical protein